MNPDQGSRIELHTSAHEWRDHLDFTDRNGKIEMRAVHAGDQLELWRDGAWIRVRYESSPNQRGWLYNNNGQAERLERQTMRLRWPIAR